MSAPTTEWTDQQALEEREALKTVLYRLTLPKGEHVLGGSGSIVMHGFKRHQAIGDIDIFVSTNYWFRQFDLYKRQWDIYIPPRDNEIARCDPPFLYKNIGGFEVNMFYDWRTRYNSVGNICIAHSIQYATIIDDYYPCWDLRSVFEWKKSVWRDKDEPDIKLLAKYFKEFPF